MKMSTVDDSGNSSSQAKDGVLQDQPQPDNISVIHARLPIPQMSHTNIEAWFTTMDFWFTASGIVADKQKTATILAALNPDVISQLTDVIASMPQSDRYEYTKARIIAHFADSEQRRLNRLLSEMPLGDKRPSELYHEMKRVAGNTVGDAALKGLWIKRLPEFAQPVVAASTGTPTEFTKIADSIIDAMASSQISSIRQGQSDEINELRVAVVELGKQFDKLSTRSRSRARKPIASRGRSENRPAYIEKATGYECWYHQKYGRKARKCRSPCKHSKRQLNVPSTNSSSPSK